MDGTVSGKIWIQHLQWAEDYFVFPNSKKALSSTIAFRFVGTGKVVIVRNKSNAMYTGASIRALLIRITDSEEVDCTEQELPTELDFGTCILEFWEENDLDDERPEWKADSQEIKCSSKWYTRILGWSDHKIKEEFGLQSRLGPDINIGML
ncbi:hypothetical protein SUNI508_13704 [Seiridium unicorne]|uniref:Uncharacterized protein n=1 Tax=Seiridium unicorne TaxID=138068 RepID=A0ABR2VBQ7_9PEZI